MNQVRKPKCRYCGLIVANNTVLKTHMRTNQECLKKRSSNCTQENTYQCNLCLKLFFSQTALDIHTTRNACSEADNTSNNRLIIHSPKYNTQHTINIEKARRRNTCNTLRYFIREYENGSISNSELQRQLIYTLNSSHSTLQT